MRLRVFEGMDEGEVGGDFFGRRWLQKNLGRAFGAQRRVIERAVSKRALRYNSRGKRSRRIDVLQKRAAKRDDR